MPTLDIDHSDGNKSNNSIENLREVTKSENGENLLKAKANNKLGVLGVSMHRKKFIARIKVNGKQIIIGRYDKIEDASMAYQEYKNKYHIKRVCV